MVSKKVGASYKIVILNEYGDIAIEILLSGSEN